eukprot:UN23961
MILHVHRRLATPLKCHAKMAIRVLHKYDVSREFLNCMVVALVFARMLLTTQTIMFLTILYAKWTTAMRVELHARQDTRVLQLRLVNLKLASTD